MSALFNLFSGLLMLFIGTLVMAVSVMVPVLFYVVLIKGVLWALS